MGDTNTDAFAGKIVDRFIANTDERMEHLNKAAMWLERAGKAIEASPGSTTKILVAQSQCLCALVQYIATAEQQYIQAMVELARNFVPRSEPKQEGGEPCDTGS